MKNSPGATYTYDNNGNMITQKTSLGTTTYTYDYENRLTSVDQYGTVIATYTYNALGQRIGARIAGHRPGRSTMDRAPTPIPMRISTVREV